MLGIRHGLITGDSDSLLGLRCGTENRQCARGSERRRCDALDPNAPAFQFIHEAGFPLAVGDNTRVVRRIERPVRARRHILSTFHTAREIGTWLTPPRLTGAWKGVKRKFYVGAHGWDESSFLDLFARLQQDPDWTTLSLACGHSIPRLAPDRAVEVLLAAAG